MLLEHLLTPAANKLTKYIQSYNNLELKSLRCVQQCCQHTSFFSTYAAVGGTHFCCWLTLLKVVFLQQNSSSFLSVQYMCKCPMQVFFLRYFWEGNFISAVGWVLYVRFLSLKKTAGERKREKKNERMIFWLLLFLFCFFRLLFKEKKGKKQGKLLIEQWLLFGENSSFFYVQ